MSRAGAVIAGGFVVLSASLVLAFTPLVWELEGRPSESYPGLFFLFVGVPLGLLVTAAGVWMSAAVRARSFTPSIGLLGPPVGAMVVGAGMFGVWGFVSVTRAGAGAGEMWLGVAGAVCAAIGICGLAFLRRRR